MVRRLGHITFRKKAKELGLFRLAKRILRGGLIAAYLSPNANCGGDEAKC